MANEAIRVIIKAEVDKAIRELQAMGVTVEKTGKNVAKAGDQAEKAGKLGFSSLGAAVIVANQAMGLANKAVQAAGKVWEEAKLGAQIQQTTDAFNIMASNIGASGDKILSSMRDTSAGTVDDVSLMQSAMRAMAFNIPTDKLQNLMAIARAASRATGESIQQSFNDIVVGIGRSSPMILDNLGLILKIGPANEAYAKSLGKTVQELTPAEQKQALLNATLDAGNELMKKVGDSALTDAEKYAKLEASMKTLTDSGAKQISHWAIPFVDWLSKIVENANESADAIAGLKKALSSQGIEQNDYSKLLQQSADRVRYYREELATLQKQQAAGTDFFNEDFWKGLPTQITALTSGRGSFADLIKLVQDQLSHEDLVTKTLQEQYEIQQKRLAQERGITLEQQQREDAARLLQQQNDEILAARDRLYGQTKEGQIAELQAQIDMVTVWKTYNLNLGKTQAILDMLNAKMKELKGTTEGITQGDFVRVYHEQLAALNQVTDAQIRFAAAQAATVPPPLPVDVQEEIDRLYNSLESLAKNSAVDALASSFDALGRSIFDAADGWDAFGRGLGNIGLQILQQLPRMMLMAGLNLILEGQWAMGLALIAGAATVGIVGGYASGAADAQSKNAQGNVYDQGELERFAMGGIVQRPTYFKFAKGTGLMGEAGPEAIMPLTRLPGGELGVKGGGGGAVTVNIYNNSDATVRQEEKNTPDGKQLDIFIESVVKSQMASGKYDGVAGARYGLKPQGVRS